MEEQKIERSLMSQEEFEDYISKGIMVLHLITYDGVHKFKSIRRAIRRGHVTTEGIIIPRRPFNNRANTSKRKGVHSRGTNELKKKIYGQLKQYQRRAS
jgi:hypothetical protein